jgi:3-isopropylmalate/(R)-2-methylmalate dehydratase small subunit
VQAFTQLRAVAAPMDLPNIDTDRIIPARYLRKPRETPGYADFLFHDVRYDGERLRPDFVLNQPAFQAAKILVAAENFGCGSSREAAVWALDAAGFRVVIAPSLGDIFHQNCFKVGVLAIILPAEAATRLRGQLHANPGSMLDVDLSTQTVVGPDGAVHRFEVDPFRKQMLLTGQDEIGVTLRYASQIGEFETRHRAAMPWLVPAPPLA